MTQIDQSGNSPQGDVVGRDKIKNVFSRQQTFMGALIDQFEKEQATDCSLEQIIEDLQHFTGEAVYTEVIGLEQKLSNGNRADTYQQCKWEKEIFYKKLLRYTPSFAAQKIMTYTLADIYTRFTNIIYPLIKDGKPRAEIDRAIQTEIVDHTITLLENNPLEFFPNDIRGMIYYLTGNCHIKWN